MAEVTDTFLSGVARLTWNEAHGGSLFDGTSYYQPHASGDPPKTEPWNLRAAASTGTYTISQAVAASLATGTTRGAHYTGQFVDPSGVSHWLGVSGGAVAVLPDGPPPAPPP